MTMLLQSKSQKLALVAAGVIIALAAFVLIVLPYIPVGKDMGLSYLDTTKRVVMTKGFFGWKTDTTFSTFGDVMDYAVRGDTRAALVRSKETGRINVTQVIVVQNGEPQQITTDPVEKFGVSVAPNEGAVAYSIFRSNNPGVLFSPALALWESAVLNLSTKETVALPGYGPQFLSNTLVLTTTTEGYLVTNLETSQTALLPVRLLPLIDVAPTVNEQGNLMIAYDPIMKRYTAYEIFRVWPELGIEPVSTVASGDLIFPAFVENRVAFVRSTPEEMSIDLRSAMAIDQSATLYPLPEGTRAMRIR